MSINKKVGENISKLRKAKKLSQGELAKILGVNRSYISTLENGSRNPSVETLQKIAKIHEYGTGEYTVRWGNSDVTTKIPARPHWRPAWEEAKTIVENMGQFAFPKNLEEALRKLV